MEMDVNTENLYGYYLPFGLTYIYRRGDEYKDIFPVWDWARLPGVTSPHHAFSSSGRSSQQTSFVGGVSDGTYGVSTMDLDVKDTQAKKSWFWFDREWIALGTGIQSTNEHPIVTGINQTLLKGEGYNVVAIPLAAGALYAWGVLLTPALGAVLMAASTVIVAINARLLRLKKGQGEKREQELLVNTKERENRDQKAMPTLTEKET
jgi:hypothetical protein